MDLESCLSGIRYQVKAMDDEQQRKADIFARCESMGEDAVRGEVHVKARLFHHTELPTAAKWLYAHNRKRNERVMQENVTAPRRSIFVVAVSAFFAGVAAVAALVTPILTYRHNL